MHGVLGVAKRALGMIQFSTPVDDAFALTFKLLELAELTSLGNRILGRILGLRVIQPTTLFPVIAVEIGRVGNHVRDTRLLVFESRRELPAFGVEKLFSFDE